MPTNSIERDIEPCMRVNLRDTKITCGYAKGHTGPCSFGLRSKRAVSAVASSVVIRETDEIAGMDFHYISIYFEWHCPVCNEAHCAEENGLPSNLRGLVGMNVERNCSVATVMVPLNVDVDSTVAFASMRKAEEAMEWVKEVT